MALDLIKMFLGNELSKLYIAQYFSEKKKAICETYVQLLRLSFEDIINQSTWMSRKTQLKSVMKLKSFEIEIGYPKKYSSYDGFWSEVSKTNETQTKNKTLSELYMDFYSWTWYNKALKYFYKKTDKDIWDGKPYEVNAFFNKHTNKVMIPAGIIQMPFFGHDTLEENLGGLGVVICHEMTHGFDDQGRKYDKYGNYISNTSKWWTKNDVSKYITQANVLESYYSSYKLYGKNLNGKLNIGENIADIGGLRIALNALKMYGITANNLTKFFESYAITWRSISRKECVLKQILTDEHTPTSIRINATLSLLNEFHKTYKTKSGDKMYIPKSERQTIW